MLGEIVLCQRVASGLMKKSFRVESKEDYIASERGCDLSHATRLVPALDPFVRNQSNLMSVAQQLLGR